MAVGAGGGSSPGGRGERLHLLSLGAPTVDSDVEGEGDIPELDSVITVKRWISPPLQAWLGATRSANGDYRHTLLHETTPSRADGLAALGGLVAEAHRDVRDRLARLTGESLDPLGDEMVVDWHYPDALHTSVLQGYLGEVLAGVVAENYQLHEREWIVPAFLFRGHLAALQDLERRRHLGGPARPVLGRTGDDALAFEVDDSGAVTAWLWAEAKCTHDHDAGLIAAGHQQLSSAIPVPVDLLQLIEILSERGGPEAGLWVASLRELLFSSNPPPRFDTLVYVCGRKPQNSTNWIPQDEPHDQYTGQRPLEAVEVQFDNFDEVLLAAYPCHVINRG